MGELATLKTNEHVLIQYDMACRQLSRALSEAKNVQEVKLIHGTAGAIRIYAKLAGDKKASADAWEIRQTAERVLGEMMHNGKDDRAHVGGQTKGPERHPSLSEIGIGKGLAHRARKLFKLTEKAFKLYLIDGRANVEHAVERTIGRTENGQHRTTPMTECPKCGYRWSR